MTNSATPLDYSPGLPAAGVSKKMLWAGRVASTLPVLLLLMSAVMKFRKTPEVVDGFAHFGYAEHLILVLGIVEISCTILYVIPQTAVLGAILLTGYLGGAVATHARVGEPQFIRPALLGVLVWLGLYMRDLRIRALVPVRHS